MSTSWQPPMTAPDKEARIKVDNHVQPLAPPYAPTIASGTTGRDEQISVLALVNIALRWRYLIIGAAFLSGLAVSVKELRKHRTYGAGASFITQGSKAPSNLAGIAAQFGVNVSSQESSQSPAFYLDLIRSRGILGNVVESRYALSSDTGKAVVTLDRVFGIEAETPAQRREQTIIALRDQITSSLNAKTGMLIFAVRSPDPYLSYGIANRILAELNRFNLERRQSQAAAERRFTQDRATEAQAALRDAEDRKQLFLQRNRGNYQNSPNLVFEADRLQRDIALRQEVFSSLSQSLEQAKIEEVRDTPVITIVEAPEVAAFPERRGLIRKGLAALAGGAIVGLLLAIAREWFGRARAESRDDAAEFIRLRRELLSDLRHPLSAIARTARTRQGARR